MKRRFSLLNFIGLMVAIAIVVAASGLSDPWRNAITCGLVGFLCPSIFPRRDQ